MHKSQEEAGKIASKAHKPTPLSRLVDFVRIRVHNMGLLPRLLIAEVIVSLLLFSGGVILTNHTANSLRNNIKQERLLLGKAIADDLDASLDNAIVELQQVASEYRVADNAIEVQGTLDTLADTSKMFTQGIVIAGPGGAVISEDHSHTDLANLNLAQYLPGLWNPALKAGDVQASAFHVSGYNSPWVAITIPMGSAHPGEYVIGMVDTMNSYPAQVVHSAVRLGGSGHADIVDARGVDLFSTETEHLLVGSDHPDAYRSLFAKNQAVIAELRQEEKGAHLPGTHLMAFVPLKTLPWAISIGTTVSQAFAPVQRVWDYSLGFLAVLLGLAFLATIFIGRRLVRPVKALSRAAKNVVVGQRSRAIEIPWGGEIGELASSLETMRQRLQAWGADLEEAVGKRTLELEERNLELKELYETLSAKETQLRALLEKVLSAQEDERKRVSRELHDGIGQSLTALILGLESLERLNPDQWVDLKNQAGRLKGLAHDALDDLRRLTVALRPAALDDLGLVPAVRRYAELYLVASVTDLQIQEEGLKSRLDSSLETVVYRVVQEAINNIARHSGATRVAIRLQSTENMLVVTVEDNGRGFDSTSKSFRQGLGLQGMRERASLAGGKLTVDSRPGQGTTVRLEIPIQGKVKTQKND